MVDGKVQVGRHAVGARRPLEIAERRRLFGNQQNGIVEAVADQRLHVREIRAHLVRACLDRSFVLRTER